jgi:hypothetical protein
MKVEKISNQLPVDKRTEGMSVLENESRRLEYHTSVTTFDRAWA